jgi:hypothetical protein
LAPDDAYCDDHRHDDATGPHAATPRRPRARLQRILLLLFRGLTLDPPDPPPSAFRVPRRACLALISSTEDSGVPRHALTAA